VTDLEPGGPYSPERTAEVAALPGEAIRHLNVATLDDPAGALGDPQNLDRVIASLAEMAQRAPQLLGQLRDWLNAAVRAGRTEITSGRFEHREMLAADVVAMALDEAAARFADAGRALAKAQEVTSAISGVDGDDLEGR
jgi:hypothetical protein